MLKMCLLCDQVCFVIQIQWIKSREGVMVPAWKPHEWAQLIDGIQKCRSLCPGFVVRCISMSTSWCLLGCMGDNTPLLIPIEQVSVELFAPEMQLLRVLLQSTG